MTTRLPPKTELLMRMSLLFRSRNRVLYRCIGPALLAVGLILMLYALAFHSESLTSEDLVLTLFALAAISTGWALSVFFSMSQMAHEILLRLDDDCNKAHGIGVEGRENGIIPKCASAGSSDESPSGAWLRELSTDRLSAGWRLVVMVPLVVGALLLTLSIGALQVPRLGDFVSQHGMPLEYLCIGGLFLMATGAYLLILEGMVYRRMSKRVRRTDTNGMKLAESDCKVSAHQNDS